MLSITNPATGKALGKIDEDTAASVKEKFELAKTAQGKWARTPLEKRIACIKKFRELLVSKKEDLAKILTSEVGKPISQARNEINGTLPRLDFFVDNVAAVLNEEGVFEDKTIKERISHEPLGVIGNISAWNYPWFVGANVFLPALLTGNAMLYKPSEFSTLTGLEIGKLLHEAGVPRDVFIVLTGGGSVGTELLKQPLNGVYFTGSFPTGKKVIEGAAKHMARVQLELGGKDPVYVCDDVDVTAAAAGIADGAFYNTGQSCCSVERIYVHEKIHDAFVEAFTAEVAKFVVGDPTDDKTYIGPLTRSAQLDVLEAQVKDAVAKGAHLACGGKRIKGDGNYFQPTVLTSVTHKMEVMREESFGPIIGIQKVKSDEEALSLMNETSYGLTAGVYTKNEKRAREILKDVNAGSVYWNCCDRVSPRLPWSGRNHSGVGVTLSKYGILAFTQPKAWHLRNS